MEIGQWRRDKFGNIFEIIDIIQISNLKGSLGKFLNIKVADTPQELIEVGDLYRIKNNLGKSLLTEYSEGDLGVAIFNLQKDMICEILTPNQNGGYDLQWSVSKDK